MNTIPPNKPPSLNESLHSTKYLKLSECFLKNGKLCTHYSEYASKNYPFEFYSTEILLSEEARQLWIKEDLSPRTLSTF